MVDIWDGGNFKLKIVSPTRGEGEDGWRIVQYYLSPYPGVQIRELQQCMHIDITHKLKIYNQHFHFVECFANQEKYQLQMKITFYVYG